MRKIILGAIGLYRVIKFVFPSHCKFIPSCSEYAREAFLKYPVAKAAGLTVKRLIKCHPFSPGRVDFLE